ncbi:hypothetical protein ACHAPA_011112 [Fusarium lateritium]
MIEGKYKESQPNDQGLLEIGASDWNAHALIILLDIIHGHHYQVPRKLDVEAVAHIGLLVDYYDCLEVVQIFFDRWRLGILDWTTDFWGPVVGHPASKRKSFGRNGTLLLFIAWAFRCSSAFSGLSSWAIVNTEGVIETDLPIPTQVPAKIDQKRVEFIDQLFSKLYSLQEDLVVGRVGCSLECSCRLLGYLMKQMRANNLPATKPDKPFTGWSIPGVVEIIRSIKTPTWRNSNPVDLCNLETHFGDSYSRTGFDPSGTQPSSKNKIGNPAFPGITSSNGPNWVGYLTGGYNESPFLTYNFGTSGAIVGTPNGDKSRYTVDREIRENFQPHYKLGKTFSSDSSLFAVWIGINDVVLSYSDRTSKTYDVSFQSYKNRIESLYKDGARNFLLLTVPPLQHTPRITKSSDASRKARSITEAVQDWNKRIRLLQAQFLKAHPSANVFVYDTYPLFQQVYQRPSQFKETSVYKDTKNYCTKYAKGTKTPETKLDGCKYAADEYLWINDLHPTSPIHRLLGKDIARFLSTK